MSAYKPELSFRLPRIESALSANVGECSIVAAEVNRKAHGLMAQEGASKLENLYVMDTEGELSEPWYGNFEVAPLTNEITLPDQRPIRFVLAKNIPTTVSDVDIPIVMYGVVRGNMAFPMASFMRRAGSFCDYIQIGTEMNDDDVIVTPKDEVKSRKETIDIINSMLDVQPLALLYTGAFEKISKNDANVLLAAINGRSSYVRIIKPAMSKKDAQLSAILDLGDQAGYFGKPSTEDDNYIFGSLREGKGEFVGSMEARTIRPSHWIKKTQKKVAKPDKLDIEKIIAEKLPGTKSPITKRILLRMALDARGINGIAVPAAERAAVAAANALGLPAVINERVGKYDPRFEKILQFTGDLATRGVTREVVIEDLNMASSSRADTELSLRAQKLAAAGDYVLRLLARPVALAEDDFYEVGEHTVRTFYPNNEFISEDVREISDIIEIMGKVG